MLSTSASAYPDSKPHYAILDGLRGVASLVVVAFHLLEAHAASHADQIINHGYLAVDFFFVLSGFVIGYAYDDRWGRMTYRDFFKRRLIRLHPMVVMGMLIGAAAFYFGAGGPYEMIAGVPVGRMLLILLLGCLMIPVPPSMDIRGWSETYPLDGPAWSLFFEYIANICYAFVLRRLSKLMLGVLAVVAAYFTVRLTVTQGDMIGGWALDGEQLGVGFTRLAYPFIAGLLLSRIGKLIRLRGAFWLCSLCIVAALAVPHLGEERLWLNGLYDAACIIVLFPLIVAAGAGGKVTDRVSKKVCNFLGDISYPLYITHYPFVYIYTAWVVDTRPAWTEALGYGALVYCGSILLAWLCLHLYDEPVRGWLKRRFMQRKPVRG